MTQLETKSLSPDAYGAGDSASSLMFGATAAVALIWAITFPAQAGVTGEPVTYEAASAQSWGSEQTGLTDEGSNEIGRAHV